MKVDGDLVNGDCNREMLNIGIIGEEGVGEKADEGDGVMDEGDKSSTTCVTRTVFIDSGEGWEGDC